jgi:hypothetical protein
MAITDTLATLSDLGFEHVLLWLFTFAIINGLFAQGKILDNARETRAIIGIVAGLFVVLSTPVEMIAVISNMSAGMILVIMAFLAVMVFFEAAQIKHIPKKVVQAKDGSVRQFDDPENATSFFTQHPYIMAAVMIIIAVLLFFGSGGGVLLGIEGVDITNDNISSVGLIIVVIVAVIWLIKEEAPKKQ